jgi:hypothetical protein
LKPFNKREWEIKQDIAALRAVKQRKREAIVGASRAHEYVTDQAKKKWNDTWGEGPLEQRGLREGRQHRRRAVPASAKAHCSII